MGHLRNTGVYKSNRQPGDLGVLRRVAEGVAEEARTRGFASQPFGWFAFVAGEIVRLIRPGSILEFT